MTLDERLREIDGLYEKATRGEVRLSKSGYSIRTGWGEDKKILGAAPRAVIEPQVTAATVNEWIDNAEFWCALVNAWPEISARLRGGWISVKEELPESRNAVLICGQDWKDCDIGYWDGDKWRLYDERGSAIYSITHWKPLPAPPEGDKQ